MESPTSARRSALDRDRGLLDCVRAGFTEGARHGLGKVVGVNGAAVHIVFARGNAFEERRPVGDRVAHGPVFGLAFLGEETYIGWQLATG